MDYTFKEAIRILEKHGWFRIKGGKHTRLKHANSKNTIQFPSNSNKSLSDIYYSTIKRNTGRSLSELDFDSNDRESRMDNFRSLNNNLLEKLTLNEKKDVSDATVGPYTFVGMQQPTILMQFWQFIDDMVRLKQDSAKLNILEEEILKLKNDLQLKNIETNNLKQKIEWLSKIPERVPERVPERALPSHTRREKRILNRQIVEDICRELKARGGFVRKVDESETLWKQFKNRYSSLYRKGCNVSFILHNSLEEIFKKVKV